MTPRRWLAAAVCVAGLAACSPTPSGPTDAPSGSSDAPSGNDERAEAEELLRSEGYLADDGSVEFGPAGPGTDEVDVHEALCTYVFGAEGEVAERAGLDEAVLADGSGYRMLGANGSGVECAWGAPEAPVLVLASWGSSDRFDDDEDALEVLVELPDGVGVAHYDPDSDVERLPADELEEWLTEAPAVTQSV
ncbi:hypothetical protein [Georgenia sp. Z1491]|uniref:hypothetical protein n=1 Tax=Georgenia sp. Z1491 TaxID=3416707 RepID=UPI003CE8971A